MRVEPTWLTLNRHEVPVRDLPAGFDGFRIVHLTDLHCGHHLPGHHVERAIELAMEQKADLAVVTGDFVHKGHSHVGDAAEAVGRLRAPHGVYAVLGNHDFAVRNSLGYRRYPNLHAAIVGALAANGVKVLRNEGVHLSRGHERLCLAGVDDLWSRACDLASALDHLPADRPRVLLAHNPRTVEHLGSRRCDLVLSGHTHGGQINWPGVGRIGLGPKARRFASGMYRHRDTHVYVNNGVGFGSVRFRFGVRPEVAVLTLRRG
jgi:hypothetical protein